MHQQPGILTHRQPSTNLVSTTMCSQIHQRGLPQAGNDLRFSDQGWKTLQEQRMQAKLVMMYRITHRFIGPMAPPSSPQHTSSIHVLSCTILQDWCLPVLLLPISHTTMEPATGVHHLSAHLGNLQGRAGRLPVQEMFLSDFWPL